MQRELVWVLAFFRRRWGLILGVLARVDAPGLCDGFEVVVLGPVVCDRGGIRMMSCRGMKGMSPAAGGKRQQVHGTKEGPGVVGGMGGDMGDGDRRSGGDGMPPRHTRDSDKGGRPKLLFR